MFQRSSPLWYATWNNLYYTFNFVPMFQRSRHFWHAFWFYLQIFNFVPMFQRSRHLWYPLWFYLLTIGFANQVFLYGYLAIWFPCRCWGGRIHFMYCLTSQASPFLRCAFVLIPMFLNLTLINPISDRCTLVVNYSFLTKNVDEREKFWRNLVKQAQKEFWPISASQIFLGSL